MSAPPPLPWPEFSQDPRRPESAPLRASDRDRDVALRVLGDGYADGRLTREEYDERSEAVTKARTLGELPAIIADLVPDRSTRPVDDLVLASPDELRTRAVKAYESSRRGALSGMLIPSFITTVVWLAAGMGFYWPIFVVMGTAINVIRVLLHKQDMIDQEQRKLEKKQRRALEAPPDKE